jgi:signal transduction histidine kinase
MKNAKMLTPALLALSALSFSEPVSAQAEERINLVIVYGDDECPVSEGGEIVVCPRFDESERFRIPPDLRGNPDALSEQSWSNRVKSYEMVGASGAMSCSPSGAGGFTGCTQQLVGNYWAERDSMGASQAGRMVEEERAKRLAELDQEAEAEQARVDAAIAEQERQRSARDAADGVPPPADVPVTDTELPMPQ